VAVDNGPDNEEGKHEKWSLEALFAIAWWVVELLSEGLHSVSGGGGTFELRALQFTEAGEFRGMRVIGLEADNPAGLRLVRDTNGFRLTAPAAATTYLLELSRTSPDGLQVLHHLNVPLAAGATHIVHPDWPTLGSGPTSLAVDLTGVGVADESILLDNQAPSAAIWTGWDAGKVRFEIGLRQGAPTFQVVALANDPYQVEISQDLVEWGSSGMVTANSGVGLDIAPAGLPFAETAVTRSCVLPHAQLPASPLGVTGWMTCQSRSLKPGTELGWNVGLLLNR